MGPKLKLKIESQGVRLLFGIEKERVGSPPRFDEQFASRLELKRKGLVLHLDLSSKKPALLNSMYLLVRKNRLLLSLYFPNFSSAFSQQLAKQSNSIE